MASPSNGSFLKVLVPLIGVGLAIAVGWAMLVNNQRPSTPAGSGSQAPSAAPSAASKAQTPANASPASGTGTATPPSPAPASATSEAPVMQATPSAAPAPTTPAPAAGGDTAADATSDLLAGLRARPTGGDPGASFAAVGSLDEASGYRFRVEFSPVGAGISALDLTPHWTTIKRQEHYRLQSRATGASNDFTGLGLVKLDVSRQGDQKATEVFLNGYGGPSSGAFTPIWTQTAPGHFEATIVNAQDRPIVKVRRVFEIKPGQSLFTLRQSAENVSGVPLYIRWQQLGPVELPMDKATYGLDKRRVRFGYQLAPAQQGGDPTVLAKEFLWDRGTDQVLGKLNKTTNLYDAAHLVWPNKTSTGDGLRLAWAAMSNRYFGVALLPVLGQGTADRTWPQIETVYRLMLDPAHAESAMTLYLTSAAPLIAPGQSSDFSMNVYAGPMSKPAIRAEAPAAASGLDALVAYNLGGPCGPCTFEILTGALINLLRVLHDYLVFDWALAIMVLVLVVRGLLHPITKWSQIRIQRFGKQMADMAPKQKKLQEKYANDQMKLREETAKLWREEGINPAGALGCLPLFLQTPVWMALYATLFFAVELRHEAAFFGVFQKISPSWSFLGDLAEPDHFIWLPAQIHFHLPLLGEITGINVLPVVLGIVFFIQQKYFSPTPTTAMTPEQELQQKMIKYMMVFMFPVMMYNAPSGLAIYFITNSVLGILESRWIKAHIEKHKLLEIKKPTGGAGGGFLARLQKMAEDRQRQMGQASKRQPPPGGKRTR